MKIQEIRDLINKDFAPNHVIPKRQCPKWRFQIEGYIKELSMIGLDSEYHSRMIKLPGDV